MARPVRYRDLTVCSHVMGSLKQYVTRGGVEGSERLRTVSRVLRAGPAACSTALASARGVGLT